MNKHTHRPERLYLVALVLALVMCVPVWGAVAQEAAPAQIAWDYEADVVVIGAGGSGLPAALKALVDGASVLVVEANWDCGGHTAVSEGQLHSGGGTLSQRQWQIPDSADLYYYDHTRGQYIGSRFNDRDYTRSVANSMAETYDFIVKHGIVVREIEPMVRAYYRDGGVDGDSVGRMTYVDASMWENRLTGTSAAGIGVTRPLEKSLRDMGAKFLMNYHMDKIYREDAFSGKVMGVMATYTPHIMPGETEPLKGWFSEGNIDSTKEQVNIKANKGVIIATGGSTGNVTFRTMFDPRLGPEYDGLAGMPFSDQDASGEIAAMEVGAGLASLSSYSMDGGFQMTAPRRFGCRYGYGTGFNEKSKVWPLVVASGIIPAYDSLVIVNMLGSRVGNEDQYASSQMTDTRFEFLHNALNSVFIDADGDGNAEAYGGPLWAILDEEAVRRNDWVMEQGKVDFDNGYAFKADTIEELAQKIVNKYYEHIKMDPQTLAETIARYNGFVAQGKDEDWGRENLVHTIEQGPFYALWATPSLHDTFSGIRVDGQMQVLDLRGKAIPNLFACGEATGGMSVHGLGRVITSGYIAGRAAASVNEEGLATANLALNPEYAGDETNHLTKTDKAQYFAPRGGAIATMTHSEKEAELAALKEQATQEQPAVEEAAQTAAHQDAEPKSGAQFMGTSDKGLGGAIQLEITVEDGKITAIEVVKHNETAGIGPEAMEVLIAQVLEKQSAEVDVVSNATVTSEAFLEALQLAMDKAGIK